MLSPRECAERDHEFDKLRVAISGAYAYFTRL
jgi:hypothetical protein